MRRRVIFDWHIHRRFAVRVFLKSRAQRAEDTGQSALIWVCYRLVSSYSLAGSRWPAASGIPRQRLPARRSVPHGLRGRRRRLFIVLRLLVRGEPVETVGDAQRARRHAVCQSQSEGVIENLEGSVWLYFVGIVE